MPRQAEKYDTPTAHHKAVKDRVFEWLFQQSILAILLIGLAAYVIHRDEEERKAEIVALKVEMAACRQRRSEQDQQITKLANDVTELSIKIVELAQRVPR